MTQAKAEATLLFLKREASGEWIFEPGRHSLLTQFLEQAGRNGIFRLTREYSSLLPAAKRYRVSAETMWLLAPHFGNWVEMRAEVERQASHEAYARENGTLRPRGQSEACPACGRGYDVFRPYARVCTHCLQTACLYCYERHIQQRHTPTPKQGQTRGSLCCPACGSSSATLAHCAHCGGSLCPQCLAQHFQANHRRPVKPELVCPGCQGLTASVGYCLHCHSALCETCLNRHVSYHGSVWACPGCQGTLGLTSARLCSHCQHWLCSDCLRKPEHAGISSRGQWEIRDKQGRVCLQDVHIEFDFTPAVERTKTPQNLREHIQRLQQGMKWEYSCPSTDPSETPYMTRVDGVFEEVPQSVLDAFRALGIEPTRKVALIRKAFRTGLLGQVATGETKQVSLRFHAFRGVIEAWTGTTW